MRRIFHPLIFWLADANEAQLIRTIEFLKEENKILRSRLPKAPRLTAEERNRLLKYGRPLGAAIKHLISIVTAATFFRWVRAGKPTKPRNGVGRPRTCVEIQELICRIASETGWGYTRILGELRRLGIRVSRQTVIRILKQNGFDPGPKRGEGTWDEFVRIHASTLWACDFFSKTVWTLKGRVQMFFLAFIHIESRKVWVSTATAHPDSAWVAQQARNVCFEFDRFPERPRFVLCDRDTKFTKEFRAVFRGEGIRVKRARPMSPNLNAFAERWIQSIQQECLDHFTCFGEDHVNHIVRVWTDYYNNQRPHQSKGNLPLTGEPPKDWSEPVSLEVARREKLGGLIKWYERRAA